MHNAIGTSAAIGFPIALAGAAGYAFNGLSVGSLPPTICRYNAKKAGVSPGQRKEHKWQYVLPGKKVNV